MTTRPVDFLLLGGGLASVTAAETLRGEGADGSIVVIGAEDRLPYHRPPLLGELAKADPFGEPLPVLDSDGYREQRIELLRGVRALRVDPQQHEVTTDKAGQFTYGKLLIATGCTPARLQMPGHDLGGIYYLRTAEDAFEIHAAVPRSRRCVVIGASFIGMEVSSALRNRGIDVHLVTGTAGVFGPLKDPAVSEFFASLYAERGIDVVCSTAVRFEGVEAVNTVVLADGRRLACDLVVIGIGVKPEVDFLHDSGLAAEDGVVVDQYLQGSLPDVYAAGDVANFFDPVFNRRHRIEHWGNAIKQGKLAARNMLGQRRPYDEVSGFFCHVFDVDFQFIGTADGAERRRSLGAASSRSWAQLFLKDSVPRALFTMGRPARETAAIEALIRYRTNIGRFESDLGQPGFALTSIPSQTILVLQGGGAMGAFETGVVQALEGAGVHPDIVAGVSIGAFNGAIVASHPRRAAAALEAFWHDLALASPPLADERARQAWSSMLVLLFGVPRFFTPRWWPFSSNPTDALQAWTSFYDPSPVRRLLAQYVDFEALKSSPVRLLVSAVDVETAQLEVFDSYVDEVTVDHLVASGSLPPGFPWTTIGPKHYWDGGIVSNSPLDQVIERSGAGGKRVVIVDLFPHARPLPSNMIEVVARRDEIVYAERIRRAGAEHDLLRDARKLVGGILSMVDAATAARIRELPPYIELMGTPDTPSIIRIIREGKIGEPAGRDFDFSLPSVRGLIAEGLEAGSRALRQHGIEAESAPASRRRTA
ncbi:MAG TPA: FAD-dependent oxidoreductase [Burkholderiaceae bacterium]|nr:FAD-dependent oxidoreductase [Burkholderiaceae bacterium]